MSRRSCILLCEDQTHAMFARQFFNKKGWQVQKVLVAPSGEGAAERHVRERYPKQLKAMRKKNVAMALVVMIDADNLGAEKRMQQLDEECREQDIDKWRKTDRVRVAVFVPDRAIEDWIRYLEGEPELNKRECKERVKPAVRKLLDICDGGGDLPEGFPPSLRRACDEWQQFA